MLVRHVMEGSAARRQAVHGQLSISWGMARDEGNANVQVFQMRDGVLGDRRSFTLENVEGESDEDILQRFFAQYYSMALTLPPEIIVPRVSGERDGQTALNSSSELPRLPGDG